ncbi:hypothetical protein [Piscirickettsia litoralis]|uniref:Uncharacterized protein n=1 Tax=Piscirickettsia litoralis TaxID=1891921 RepID=A0ABX2ZXU8_9GAMM|nr:hypothetical protein [Piscirickettsia litoralis]ODN41446.1 hypothetical protein BGC07_15085 [Piscirickettsia litoralis]
MSDYKDQADIILELEGEISEESFRQLLSKVDLVGSISRKGYKKLSTLETVSKNIDLAQRLLDLEGDLPEEKFKAILAKPGNIKKARELLKKVPGLDAATLIDSLFGEHSTNANNLLKIVEECNVVAYKDLLKDLGLIRALSAVVGKNKLNTGDCDGVVKQKELIKKIAKKVKGANLDTLRAVSDYKDQADIILELEGKISEESFRQLLEEVAFVKNVKKISDADLETLQIAFGKKPIAEKILELTERLRLRLSKDDFQKLLDEKNITIVEGILNKVRDADLITLNITLEDIDFANKVLKLFESTSCSKYEFETLLQKKELVEDILEKVTDADLEFLSVALSKKPND